MSTNYVRPNEMVAANIRAMRAVRKWSCQHLANRLEELTPGTTLDRRVLSKIETGERRITVDELPELAAAFSLASPWDLATVQCPTCQGAPPARFTCTDCGRTGQ